MEVARNVLLVIQLKMGNVLEIKRKELTLLLSLDAHKQMQKEIAINVPLGSSSKMDNVELLMTNARFGMSSLDYVLNALLVIIYLMEIVYRQILRNFWQKYRLLQIADKLTSMDSVFNAYKGFLITMVSVIKLTINAKNGIKLVVLALNAIQVFRFIVITAWLRKYK